MNTARADKGYLQLIREFPLVPLRDQSEFSEAIVIMKRLACSRDALSRGEADYLEVLGELIAQYEHSLPKLAEGMTPREALAYLMDVNGLAQADLFEYVGYRSNLSAFLSGHRGLSPRAACRLGEYFKVSPMLFLSKQ